MAQRNLGLIYLLMTVETKFNIGDEVWYLHNNKVCNRKVSAINIRITECMVSIIYYISAPKESITLEEKSIFSSKEELLKSL